jgi:cyclase
MKIRVIPSILIDGSNQVKGKGFNNWRKVGSPIASAQLHAARDVDELLIVDVRATIENRTISERLVKDLAASVRIPICVGGGIRDQQAISSILEAGADKVLLGTAAVENIRFVELVSRTFGSQAIVCSVDAGPGQQRVTSCSARVEHQISPLDFARKLEDCGAGELLVQDVVFDGKMEGMPLELIRAVSSQTSIPIIAGTGAGTPWHAVEAAQAGAGAISVGSMLQFTRFTPADIKNALKEAGFNVRN